MTSNGRNEQDWSEQTPIPIDRHELTAIPANTFQGWLGDMAGAVADQIETPIELPAILGLSAIATAIQGKFSLLIEPGYFEPLNIWVVVAMEPSNRKSSALKSMNGPIEQFERDQRETVNPEIQQIESIRKTRQKAIEKRRTDAAKLDDPDEAERVELEIAKTEAELPMIPIPSRLLVNDCTPEQVAIMLQQHGERISFIDSEADSLFAMMLGRYSDSPKLDVYLKAYSGDGIRVDRVNHSQPILLSHPLITIGIAPQPGLIQDIAQKPILIKRGLLSRFIFSIPKSHIGHRMLKPTPIPEGWRLRYENGLLSLLQIELPEKPHIIRLSDFAYELWKDWQHAIETMMRKDGRLHDTALKAWGGKLAGNTARVAAIMHVAELEPGEAPDSTKIGHETMMRAIAMMRVLIDHAIAAHDLAVSDSATSKAIQVLEWIRFNWNDPVITVRDVQQALKHRSDFRSVNDVREAFRVLEDHGWIQRLASESKSGRPSERYALHPYTR